MLINVPFINDLSARDYPDSTIETLNSLGARDIVDSLNWPALYPYHPLTTVTTAHNGEHLFIDFFVRCNYLRAVNEANNSPVSQDSCVEFFVAPRPDDPTYWNFEFNCIGAVNASHRQLRPRPVRLSDDQLASIIRVPSCGTRPFREIEGLFTWNIMVAIPLSLLGITHNGDPVAMKGNFYKCASGTSQPHFLSWAPVRTEKPDFHRPEFFGDIILG